MKLFAMGAAIQGGVLAGSKKMSLRISLAIIIGIENDEMYLQNLLERNATIQPSKSGLFNVPEIINQLIEYSSLQVKRQCFR